MGPFVKDLNPNLTLFKGEAVAVDRRGGGDLRHPAIGKQAWVTKYVSEINLSQRPGRGDIIEIGIVATAFGRTSIAAGAKSEQDDRQPILSIDKLIFVNLDEGESRCPTAKQSYLWRRTGSRN